MTEAPARADDAGPLIEGAHALGIHLSDRQVEQFRQYHQALLDWNEAAGLTTVTEWERVQGRHFLDSLTASSAMPVPGLTGLRVLDVGSGGGFPGVPLAIAFPGVELTVLDSAARRTAFLTHLVRVLGLPGVSVLTGRAEALAHEPSLRESFDVVLARALAKVAVLAELTLPFARTGGIVIAHKSRGVEAELADGKAAVEVTGGHVKGVVPVELAGVGPRRALLVLEKRDSTPLRYPRRPGVPAKRPLMVKGVA